MEDGSAKPADGPGLPRSLDARAPPDRDILAAALETTRVPMVVAEARLPDCPIVFANDAFLALTGYGREDVLGRDCRFLQGPKTDRAAKAEIAAALRRGEPVSVELLNYRKDGTAFWNALHLSPIIGSSGAITHFLGSQGDVTQRHTVEEALGRSQKMEALGQLTGGIAHDFNNLLQVILGYVDVVSSGLKKPDADRARLSRATDSIRSAAERAAKLTQQVLSFARKQRVEGRLLDLNALIAGMDDLILRTLGETITLETRLAPDLWTCRVDPTQAEVALLNILINARDAMPAGGTVTIVTENRRIDGGIAARGAPDGRVISLAVTDTGTGIAPEILAHVTDPFFTTKDEGTGLGLSMVHGFAKQSGGSAQIESVLGEGTTIRLSIPASDRARESSRPRESAESETGGSETILIVDDREDVADLARTILRDHGYVPLVAVNGREALRILDSREDVALLFSDLIMPGGMNGVMLAREARRMRPALKVLLTTGYAEASLERTDIGGSEFDLLNKPYRRADLVARVRRALDSP